jgi:L-iditol 2-dehydrogenase
MKPPADMRVARFYAWNDVRVEEQPVPRIGPGEALIRVEACGVCGSDVLRWYVEAKAPIVLGHEPAGTVVAVGEGVEQLRVGERVFVHHHAPCGDCTECARGLWSNCATWRATRLDPGGFAEYARVMAPNVARDTLVLPHSMDFETATFIEPVACCLRALRRWGAVAEADAVAIVGLGAMGIVMVQLARILGAGSVVGSDPVEERRQLALQAGADLVVDPESASLTDAARSMTGGRGADVVVICPAVDSAFRDGIAAAAAGARVVCFTPRAPDRPLTIDQSAMYFREITLAQSYSCGPDETRESMELLAEARLDVASLVTHREGLSGVGAALERTASKSGSIKTIVFPQQ